MREDFEISVNQCCPYIISVESYSVYSFSTSILEFFSYISQRLTDNCHTSPKEIALYSSQHPTLGHQRIRDERVQANANSASSVKALSILAFRDMRNDDEKTSSQTTAQGRMREGQHATTAPPAAPAASLNDAAAEREALVAFRTDPIRPLNTKKTPVMGDMNENLTRSSEDDRKIYKLQRYFVENRTRDVFRTTTVHVPRPDDMFRAVTAPAEMQTDLLSTCPSAFIVDKHFDEPRSYDIRMNREDEALVKVVIPSNEQKWHVYNGSLFNDLNVGDVIGRIHYISSLDSFFVFSPEKEVLVGVPKLKMQPAKTDNEFGGYDLLVSGIEKRVGSVYIYRHFFDFRLKNCTKEEAVIWLILLIAAELETKTPLVAFITR